MTLCRIQIYTRSQNLLVFDYAFMPCRLRAEPAARYRDLFLILLLVLTQCLQDCRISLCLLLLGYRGTEDSPIFLTKSDFPCFTHIQYTAFAIYHACSHCIWEGLVGSTTSNMTAHRLLADKVLVFRCKY